MQPQPTGITRLLAKQTLGQPRAPSSSSLQVCSDITAWQSALQALPVEFKNQPEPIHPLPVALARQPTLRQIEWNPYRQQGGFVPRTAHDFAAIMIFICGQDNPNPCRNCRLRNGPFGKCVVSPPEVLAVSTMRHACANCTYQNQYKKCTNDPISEEEMARSRLARGAGPRVAPSLPRKPKVPAAPLRIHKKVSPNQREHVLRKPAAASISPESFVDKLCQARAWSPRSRRRMRAQALQWQAAIATVEAEKTRTFPGSGSNVSTWRHSLQAAPAPSQQPAMMSSARSLPVPSQEQDSSDLEDDDVTEVSEDGGQGDGDTWAGFEDMEATIKPPL
ncbi:hypothetical protein BJ170DRAFT_439680 [Xylariales sp. AK1849]|nr:hypothetical protein BJ170DRAFT_439680 [Xylariales sp. AK1849]